METKWRPNVLPLPGHFTTNPTENENNQGWAVINVSLEKKVARAMMVSIAMSLLTHALNLDKPGVQSHVTKHLALVLLKLQKVTLNYLLRVPTIVFI